MKIEILGTESLGVRGCCCFIETKNRKILIDPGISLGYYRYELYPHPFQVAIGERIKLKIIKRWSEATDIIISHFHGDHTPLVDANPYQLNIKKLVNLNHSVRLYTKGLSHLSKLELKRAESIFDILHKKPITAEGRNEGDVVFSMPMLHGDENSHSTTVIMTKIEENRIFVHAPGVQLLNNEAVSQIIDWHPNIVFVDGPSLYLSNNISENQIENAWYNAKELSKNVDTLIIDHHLMRSYEGIEWIEKLSSVMGKNIICGADFMGKKRMLLEASREGLYKNMPVPKNWHEQYAEGKVSVNSYWDIGNQLYGYDN